MRLTFESAFNKYQAHMIRSNYSKVTIRHKFKVLSLFNTFLQKSHIDAYNDLRAVSCEYVLEYMDSLYVREIEAISVKDYMMMHIGVFFKFLYKNDYIREDPGRKIPVVKVPKKEIVYVPHDEILKELGEILKFEKKYSRHKIALRNYFIVRVAYVTGWRAAESLACESDRDIDWEAGVIHIPKAKGGGDSYVYLDTETAKMLKNWYYSNYPNGKWLWYSKSGKQMVYIDYYRVFKKYFDKGSHRLRASFATYLFERDVDIKKIQELMRHQSIQSTMRYVAVSKDKIRGVHLKNNPFADAELVENYPNGV